VRSRDPVGDNLLTIMPDQGHCNFHEGLVSMLPATDARVFKIAGGNELLPQALLDAARVHLKLGWTVNEVLTTCGLW
jgi:hypothetical protein